MTENATGSASDKKMRLRYAGACRLCGTQLPAGQEAIYERSRRTVRCVACDPQGGVETAASADPTPVSSAAGSSARRVYERRKARDEERIRSRWGKLGGVAVALSSERQSTTAWATGAVGEEMLGLRVDAIASNQIAVLHDRRIPGRRANIDHIVVTGSAVWVIDAKRYKGRPQLRVEGGILRPRSETLLVGRRDCTKLVDGVLNQRALVQAVVGGPPVHAALCFIDADWPLIGGAFNTQGVHVLWPKRLTQLLLDGGEPVLDVASTWAALAGHFPPA